LAGGVAFYHQIESVPTRVLQLLKSEVAKFHSFILPPRRRLPFGDVTHTPRNDTY
jgi:hypothetical protein